MITLRQGKAKTILDNSMDSALLAVETYNKPNAKFRLENYIILMIVAWTKLFHAYFQTIIGERYFYKEKGKKRYKKVDGERRAWELKECIKYFKRFSKEVPLSPAMEANLFFFIGIRNKIEHTYWSASPLNLVLFGECQSLLYNYEYVITSLFGEDYSLNASLAFALQFSQLRSKEQLLSQKELQTKDLQDIKQYIDKYKTELPQEIYDSQEYSVKLIQIPKISNTNRSALSVEFVNWSMLSEEDKKNYEKIAAIIKDKMVKQPVLNVNMLKPCNVLSEVYNLTRIEISMSNHTDLWKAFQIRQSQKSKDKFKTNEKYCIYDEPHNDFLYTIEWVEFIAKLITKYDFTKENIHAKCKNALVLEEFE